MKQYLGEGITVDDLHKFPKASLLSVGVSVEAHHRLQFDSVQMENSSNIRDADVEENEVTGDDSSKWNSEDGMTHSIMSQTALEEKRFMDKLKQTLLNP